MAAPTKKAAPQEAEAVAEHVIFVPSSHTTGTTTASGATFAFSPGVAVTVSAADGQDLVSQGVGYIEGA